MIRRLNELKKYRFSQDIKLYVMPDIIKLGNSPACMGLASILEEKIKKKFDINVNVCRIYTSKHTRYKINLDDGHFIDIYIMPKPKL